MISQTTPKNQTAPTNRGPGSAPGPIIPADPLCESFSKRVNDLGMWSVSQLGRTLSTVLGSRSKNQLGILTYHRIAPHTPGVPKPTYNVTPSRFREQLTGLTRRGFRFVSLRQALDSYSSNDPLPDRSVVLTFDDCFESVYTFAWPILQELKAPATLFLSTAYLDSDQPFPFDTWSKQHLDQVPADHVRPLRVAQCREMANTGLIELGVHTHTHADFRGHLDAFRKEMDQSVEIVRTEFAVDRPTFSFPFGSVIDGFASEEMKQAARASGVSCALTTEVTLVDPTSDPFGWGRINSFCWDTSATLCGKLGGWYSWAPQLKYRLKAARQKRSAQQDTAPLSPKRGE